MKGTQIKRIVLILKEKKKSCGGSDLLYETSTRHELRGSIIIILIIIVCLFHLQPKSFIISDTSQSIDNIDYVLWSEVGF